MATKWQLIHIEECRKQKREWYRNNKQLVSDNKKKKAQKIKLIIMKYYSKGTMKCACCGENNIGFLTIDHIIPCGSKARKPNFYSWLIKNNYPLGFQVLCYNCNLGKAFSNSSKCPHNT